MKVDELIELLRQYENKDLDICYRGESSEEYIKLFGLPYELYEISNIEWDETRECLVIK